MIVFLVVLLSWLAIPDAAARGADLPIAATGLSADLEVRIDVGVREAMRLLHEGRPERAARVVDRMIEAAPRDPRPYLIQARVLREGVSEQNHIRESLKPQVAQIHAVLDRCIDLADEILARDPDSLHGLLYRGWGKMFKAQLHALTFERWSAGRTARGGKKDLDKLLERDPDNGDALMVIGTYKYFADTLPAIARFASFLLRIPGGDRREGLELLEQASRSGAASRDDARGIRGAALFGFEGALEAALPIFEELSSEYPTNPRFVEPIGLLSLFFPDRLGEDLESLRGAVRVAAKSDNAGIRNLEGRLRLYQALTELFSGRIDAARTGFELLHANPPEEPDWLLTDIYRILVDVHLLLGDRDRALALYRELDPNRSEHQDVERRLRFLVDDEAGSLASDPGEVELLRRVQVLAQALYDGRIAEADRGLDSFGATDEPVVAFYRGELYTLRGRDAAAIAQYRKLTDEKLPERWRLYRYFARLRLAEAHARQADAEKAADVLGEAIDSYPIKDLLRHVTRARKRYFERYEEYVTES